MKKTLLIIMVMILMIIAGCTAIMISGRHNAVNTDDPVGVDAKIDSIDIFDRSKTYDPELK
jgi:uncharacterized protein YxeA